MAMQHARIHVPYSCSCSGYPESLIPIRDSRLSAPSCEREKGKGTKWRLARYSPARALRHKPSPLRGAIQDDRAHGPKRGARRDEHRLRKIHLARAHLIHEPIERRHTHETDRYAARAPTAALAVPLDGCSRGRGRVADGALQLVVGSVEVLLAQEEGEGLFTAFGLVRNALGVENRHLRVIVGAGVTGGRARACGPERECARASGSG